MAISSLYSISNQLISVAQKFGIWRKEDWMKNHEWDYQDRKLTIKALMTIRLQKKFPQIDLLLQN